MNTFFFDGGISLRWLVSKILKEGLAKGRAYFIPHFNSMRIKTI